MINVTLPNGEIVDNYSTNYRLYCEAKWLSKKDPNFRINWMFKVEQKRFTELESLQKYLNLISPSENIKTHIYSTIIMP